MDSFPRIVFVAIGTNWAMNYLNQDCFNLTGYHNQELTGDRAITTYNALTNIDDRPHVLKTICCAITARQPYEVEYRIRTKFGNEITYPEGHELYMTGSIRIALYPHHGKAAQTLLKHADAAD